MRPLDTDISISRPARLKASHAGPSFSPAISWAPLAFLTIAGSLLYGASLGVVLPGWQAMGSGVWLALSAGLGWCVFLPALHLGTRKPLATCCHACLVTMVWGETVLIAGAIGNALLTFKPVINPVTFNIACVALSNVVMAAVISRQMARFSVSTWKTLALWMLALNGSGALFFYLLRFLVEAHL